MSKYVLTIQYLWCTGPLSSYTNRTDPASAAPFRQKKGRVRTIRATSSAFAAILENGEVVTWGNLFTGSDSSEVEDQLRHLDLIDDRFLFLVLWISSTVLDPKVFDSPC